MSTFFIYYKEGAKMMRPILTATEYRNLRNSQKQVSTVAAVRSGDESQKHKLLQMNYSCLPKADGSLKGATRMSNTVGMDIDHIAPEEMESVKLRILSKRQELGLLMLELSARGQGYHLVFRRRTELSQEENLLWASKLLGVEYDKGAKDITRVFFTTTASDEDLLFLDDALFEGTEECEQNYTREPTLLCKMAKPTERKIAPREFKGTPYGYIIGEWWRQHGGEPQEGERNIALHKLAVHLRTICDNNPQLLFEVMPHMGLTDQEMHSIIASATKDQPKGLTAEMKAVLTKLDIGNSHKGTAPLCGMPPEMPKKLPKLIKLLTSKTPDVYKATVAQAVFPALATHLWNVGFEYIDGVVHQATLMNVVMAETGAGKSCIDKPIQYIMADIDASDKVNLAREKAWKDDVNAEGANKKKDKRPEGLVIQHIDADMTNAAFVMRLNESDGHFLYVKLNEIQLFDALKGNGKSGQQFQIMCLAFDPDNEYGQTRVGTQSISARVKVLFNWNACTTIKEGKLYFSKVLVNGPISRINFCTIPEQPIGSPIPKYGKYDEKFAEELKPYIGNLCAARGQIFCPEAYKLAKKLNEECKVKAIESQSRTYENFSFRANVIAYLKACVLYVANGCKWEKSIEDFIRWSLEYDLWCKMEFFGDAVTQANRFNGPSNNQPQSMLLSLGKVFTRQDVERLYIERGMDVTKVPQTLRSWKHRNLIVEIGKDTYKQLKYV